jgi:hypothetical protein
VASPLSSDAVTWLKKEVVPANGDIFESLSPHTGRVLFWDGQPDHWLIDSFANI